MRFALRKHDDREPDWELILAAVGLVLLMGVAALRLIPEKYQPSHPCVFRQLTGYPCLTCGGTRAARAIGRLEFGQAIRHNPLVALWLLLALPHAGWVVAARMRGIPRPRVIAEKRRDRWILRGLLLAVLAANWAFLVVSSR